MVMQDLALATGNCVGADYVLAQDPDADRFSAAEKGCVLG
jgi:phosphomannomutase